MDGKLFNVNQDKLNSLTERFYGSSPSPVRKEEEPAPEQQAPEAEPPKSTGKRKRKYSEEEDALILAGVSEFGTQWKKIVEAKKLTRSAAAVSKRYQRLKSDDEKKPDGEEEEDDDDDDEEEGEEKVEAQEDNEYAKRLKALEDREAAIQQKAFTLQSRETTLLREAAERQRQLVVYGNRAKEALMRQLRDADQRAKREKRRDLALACLRLGSIKVERARGAIMEVWAHGSDFEDLRRKEEDLQREKQTLEQLRSELSAVKRRKGPKPPAREMAEREGILKLQARSLKSRESEIGHELAALERRVMLHRKEMKRIYDEDDSKFRFNNVFENRYVLLELLGKGGFSEVYKAYDLDTLTYVAIKIHQLAESWSQQKKRSYLLHARRELEIQKQVQHARIVQLFDSFEIDGNTWASVMSYCEGSDLDFHLKQHSKLSETEARIITLQILGALQYLHSLPKPIIHYDLKPANILFHNYEIKLTDFGLSKMLTDQDVSQMELTSQGAGTYWYLPPEVFLEQAKVSTKVDVWSVGVIFFQMVYGRKPFGNNMSQQALLQSGVLSSSTRVEFDDSVKVSDGCKQFIAHCLSPNPQFRPTVEELLQSEYIANVAFKKPTTKKRK